MLPTTQIPSDSMQQVRRNPLARLKKFKLILAGAMALAIVSASFTAPTWTSPASADGHIAITMGLDHLTYEPDPPVIRERIAITMGLDLDHLTYEPDPPVIRERIAIDLSAWDRLGLKEMVGVGR